MDYYPCFQIRQLRHIEVKTVYSRSHSWKQSGVGHRSRSFWLQSPSHHLGLSQVCGLQKCRLSKARQSSLAPAQPPSTKQFPPGQDLGLA